MGLGAGPDRIAVLGNAAFGRRERLKPPLTGITGIPGENAFIPGENAFIGGVNAFIPGGNALFNTSPIGET
jgi:hypothetical protein